MEENYRRYPIGIQNFEQLRNRNCVYVDKTELVYRLANTDSVYFLSRPRRFGKSLLVSTLEAYFQGKKDLFKGLAMERLEKDWNVYPVFHIDFSLTKYTTLFDLQEQLNLFLLRCEKVYGAEKEEKTPAARLQGMIRRAYEQTGLPVVVLIDEYDAPLLDSNSNIPLQQELRNELRKFFSPLKGLGQYLRFLFITGISKFSQMSIFSELNNLKNISMRDDFSAICGITERELLDELRPDIERMALANGETYEAACAHLKRQYDGYHFSKHCEDIYNPFSLFNAFNDGKFNSYWFGSGTPTYLIEMLNKFGVLPSEIGGIEAVAAEFDAPTERMTSITPLLYQSGYITIKGYDSVFDIYTLDIPNKEVRIGLMRNLIPSYITNDTLTTTTMVVDLARALSRGDMDAALRLLQKFLSTIPYCDNTDYEGHYQQVFFIIFNLLGYYVDVEVRTPRGRVDMVMRSWTTLYVVELKLDKSADTAMQQIDLKNYPKRFALCGLPVVKVGINFDTKRHTLADWKIEPVK